MKNFSCKVAGFHSETLLNKVSIVDVFLGIIQPFEREQFLRAIAKKYKYLFCRRFSTRLRSKTKMWKFFTCFVES